MVSQDIALSATTGSQDKQHQKEQEKDSCKKEKEGDTASEYLSMSAIADKKMDM